MGASLRSHSERTDQAHDAYPFGMKIDVTYRIVNRASGRLLRVRFRRGDGMSIVVLFPEAATTSHHFRKPLTVE
jgi:hypothetical protein